MSARVEWIGLKLPSQHPYIGSAELTFPKEQRAAIGAVTNACSAHVRWSTGVVVFQLTPAQGFSKHYKWCKENSYIEVMTDSDVALLFRPSPQQVYEHRQFRNLDDPMHRTRQPDYPTEREMSVMRFVYLFGGRPVVHVITPTQARIVTGLLRKYKDRPALTAVTIQAGDDLAKIPMRPEFRR